MWNIIYHSIKQLFALIFMKIKSIFLMNKSKLEILYLSENFLVINKPYDIAINSNDPKRITVQTILSQQLPKLVNKNLVHSFYFAHRLDYSTSGILCLPVNLEACVALSKSFNNSNVEKYYIAIVKGDVIDEYHDVQLEIGLDKRYLQTNNKMCLLKNDKEFCLSPKNAHTKILVLETGVLNNENVTKVLLKPITGRRHQLRIHCLAIGHPILGDYTYDNDTVSYRMYLHAIRIIAPNTVESFDVMTANIFSEFSLNKTSNYIRKTLYNDLNNGFEKIK